MSFDMQLIGQRDLDRPFNGSPGMLIMETYLLAFWQKHYGLHQFICGFMGESDAIQVTEISLHEEDLIKLREAIRAGQFHYDRRMMSLNVYTPEGDIAAIDYALNWLAHGPGQHSSNRHVFYTAS